MAQDKQVPGGGRRDMRLQPSRRQFNFGILGGAVAAQSLLALPLRAEGVRDLVVAAARNPATLEPCMEYSTQSWRVHFSMFDTLLRYDEANNFAVVPWLAESWNRVDDRTVDFTLREGVKFHNGDILTAEDVVFSFGPDRIKGEDAPGYSYTRATLGPIENVEALAPNLVRFTTTGPDVLLPLRLATFPAQIVSKRAFEEADSFDDWQFAPVGTGPFRIREYRDGDYILLEAFEDYWAGAPNVQTLRFQAVPELAARTSGLITGEYHIICELTPDQFGLVEGADGIVAGGPVAAIRTIAFDTNNPALRDVRVRRALSKAIDRDLIVETLWDGRIGVPNGNQWPAFGDLYFEDWPAYEYDPEGAAALVAESDYDGAEIEYRITGTNYTFETQTAEILVEMWRAAGLNMKLVYKENAQQISVPEGRGIRNWSNSMVYPDPLGGWWRLFGPQGQVQQLYHEWTNDEFNENSAILQTSLDTGERQRAWRRMMEIWHHDDPPATVLHDTGLFYGLAPGIRWTPLITEYMDFRRENLAASE